MNLLVRHYFFRQRAHTRRKNTFRSGFFLPSSIGETLIHMEMAAHLRIIMKFWRGRNSRDKNHLPNLRMRVRGRHDSLHCHQLLLPQRGQVHLRPRWRDRPKKCKDMNWSKNRLNFPLFWECQLRMKLNSGFSRLWSRSHWVHTGCPVLPSNKNSVPAGNTINHPFSKSKAKKKQYKNNTKHIPHMNWCSMESVLIISSRSENE